MAIFALFLLLVLLIMGGGGLKKGQKSAYLRSLWMLPYCALRDIFSCGPPFSFFPSFLGDQWIGSSAAAQCAAQYSLGHRQGYVKATHAQQPKMENHQSGVANPHLSCMPLLQNPSFLKQTESLWTMPLPELCSTLHRGWCIIIRTEKSLFLTLVVTSLAIGLHVT